MLQNNFVRGASAALLLLFICIIGSAQEFRGSITGKVTDPNGAIIPGATVTIKNVDTNIQATANTTDQGSYDFLYLLASARKDELSKPVGYAVGGSNISRGSSASLHFCGCL